MAEESDNAPANPFWDFSLRFYAQPNVAETCLSLQDKHGVDVNVLLYLLWLANAGKAVPQSELVAIDRHVKVWRENIVIPLRRIRRSIPKSNERDARTKFRNSVKKLELQAERIEQDKLFSLFSALEPATTVRDAARKNLKSYAEYLGADFGGDLETLLVAHAASTKF